MTWQNFCMSFFVKPQEIGVLPYIPGARINNLYYREGQNRTNLNFFTSKNLKPHHEAQDKIFRTYGDASASRIFGKRDTTPIREHPTLL